MKWIGTQTIYDHVRLVKGVTVDSVSITTIQSSGESFADNDTSLMTSAAVADKIEAYGYSTTAGDITGVTITTDSGGGSAASDTGGSADFSILGSSGVGVTNSGTTITAVAVPAEIDHDSLNNYAANEHFTRANITTVGTIGTGRWEGSTIASAYLDSDTAHLSETQTFTGAKTFSEKIEVSNTTTSSSTSGGKLLLVCDDGAAMGDDHRIGAIHFNGAEDGSNTLRTGAKIQAMADAAWSGTENGTRLEFYTMDGNNTSELSLTLDSDLLATFAGDVTVNGDALTVSATDPRVKITATAGNHPGVELYEASTRKWLLFNQPDQSDKFIIKNDSTEYFKIAQNGETEFIGNITAGTWQGTPIASAYLDADTMHYSAQRQLTHHMFKDDIGTTKHYIGLQEADAEQSASVSNKNLPLLAPVAGKLLKVFLRASSDLSGDELTWRLETVASSTSTFGSPSIIGTVAGAGCTASSMTTYDFTSVTNTINAGDQVLLSIESDDAGSDNTNDTFLITCLWQWDLS